MAGLMVILIDHHQPISSALQAIRVQPLAIPFDWDQREPFGFIQITSLDGVAIGVREFNRWKIVRFGSGLFSEFHCNGPMSFAINLHQMLAVLLWHLEQQRDLWISVTFDTNLFSVYWSTDDAEYREDVNMIPLAQLPGYELPLNVFALEDDDDHICIQLNAQMFESYMRICRQLLVENPDVVNDVSVNDLRFGISPAAAEMEMQMFGFHQTLSRTGGHYLVGLEEQEEEEEEEEEAALGEAIPDEIYMVFLHQFDCLEGCAQLADSVRLHLNQALDFRSSIVSKAVPKKIGIEEGDSVRTFPIRDPFSSPTWEPGSYSISEDALRGFRIVGGVPFRLPLRPENSVLSPSDAITEKLRGRTVRDYSLETLASKTGKTVDEVDMDLLAKCGNLAGTNWFSQSEWIPANVDAGDCFPRLNVKIVSPALKIDNSPRGIELSLQKRKICGALSENSRPLYKLDGFFVYSRECDALCRNLRPHNLQPGNVTYFVSIPLIKASTFCTSVGHPIAVVAERVSFAAARKQKKDPRKGLIRGEIDITFHSSHPFNYSTLAEEMQVEGVLVRAEGYEVEVRVDFTLLKTGKLEYSAKTTLYSTLDPVWMVKDTDNQTDEQ